MFATDHLPAEVHDTKVLICSLDARFEGLLWADEHIYSRFYPRTTAVVRSLRELLKMIAEGYDIVHLFSSVSPTGSITDAEGEALVGSSLIQSCCVSGVKLLWIASDNKADTYIKGFKAPGKPINIVMTIERQSSRFTNFLEGLLSRMSSGVTMPDAWVALSSQSPRDPRHEDLPMMIFAAGHPAVTFR